MNTPELRESFDPWRETPRKFIVIVLVSVFLFFTTIGFANDIISMGREQTARYVLGVIVPGLFAVAYAVGGISLRKRWWMAVAPIFVMEFVVMGVVATRFPDLPQHIPMNAVDVAQTRSRMMFDSIAIIVVVSLGYTGFFFVSVREARRYVTTRTEKALLESEMAAARQVQQVILPDPHRVIPGFVVESAYRPAREVGGDFFQVVPVGTSGLLFVIGDVSGKGLPAAMMVSLVIGSIRATAEGTHDPVVLLTRLHSQIAGRSPEGFVTALAAFIAEDGTVTFANAGHLSPYLDGREVALPGALPLGVGGGGQFEVTRMELRAGSRLTFVSDGVVDAQKPNGELLGFERAQGMSKDSAAAIADAAVAWGQTDDITVVTIERQADGLPLRG